MKKIIIAIQVENDLDDISDYIAKDNPRRALSFAREVRARFVQIAERPNSFPILEGWNSELRSAIHGRYHIIFIVIDDTAHILRVIHAARDINSLIGFHSS
jgi:toxin ParE1/3/4